MSRNRTQFYCPHALTLAIILSPIGSVFAQTLVSRHSHVLYSAVYGGGPDVFTPSNQVVDSTVVANDTESLQFTDSQGGFILDDPNRPWSAEVQFAAQQHFEFVGPLSNFISLSASGTSVGAAGASGEGLANLTSGNPGNRILMYFDLDSNQPVRLLGSISFIADGFSGADVLLERFDGFAWGIVFWSAFLPGGQGSFDQNYDLPAGPYRISGAASVNVYGGVRPSQDSRFNFRLNIGAPCPGDLDGDLDVDLSDLARLLSNFGMTGGASYSQGDIDANGSVDLSDLAILLANFGSTCS